VCRIYFFNLLYNVVSQLNGAANVNFITILYLKQMGYKCTSK